MFDGGREVRKRVEVDYVEVEVVGYCVWLVVGYWMEGEDEGWLLVC